MNQLAVEIRRRRKEEGLTLRELADLLGTSQPTVSRWENGQSIPDPDMRRSLAAWLAMEEEQVLVLAHRLAAGESDYNATIPRLSPAAQAEVDAIIAREIGKQQP